MSNELMHYGVQGMKWGVRRYQDKSGRRTSAGKKRYSDEDRARRKETAKKVAVGTATVLTVAAAATIYAKNKKQVDAFIAKNANKVIKTTSDLKAKRTALQEAKAKAYVKKNTSKILNSPALLNKYKSHFDKQTVDEAIKNMQRTRDLRNLATDDIRKGANYVNAIIAYGTAATTAYNLTNSQLAKDMKKTRKKKET